jgi:threonyl-tRNA synthetase
LKLFKAGIRCGVRDKKSLNFRIKSVHERIVPYYFVVGTKEIEENLFNLVDTSFNKTFEKISIDDLINKLYSEINNKKII